MLESARSNYFLIVFLGLIMCGGVCPLVINCPSKVTISDKSEHYHVVVDRKPEGVLGHFTFFVLEGEKLGVVVLLTNALFHLTAPLLEAIFSDHLFGHCLRFHEIAHDIGHLVEPLHFFADLTHLIRQNFVVYREKVVDLVHHQKRPAHPLDLKATALRASHFVLHSLSSIALFVSKKLVVLNHQNKVNPPEGVLASINEKATAARVCHLAANLFSLLALFSTLTLVYPSFFGSLVLFSPWLHATGSSLSLLDLIDRAKEVGGHVHHLRQRELLDLSAIFVQIGPIMENFGVKGSLLRSAELVSDIATLIFSLIAIKLIVIPGKETHQIAKASN